MVNSQRQSILCPNCRKLISLDEAQCPYCGTTHPGSWWKNNICIRAFRDPDRLMKAIIYANVGMFILSLLLNPRLLSLSLNPLSFLSPDSRTLLLLGASGSIPIDRFQRWWSLVSANYLHAGILHILFNMIALRQIGVLIVEEYGGSRMFAIYTLSGIFGYWISYMAGITFTVGASAAVCGLIGAALYYGKSRGGFYGGTIYRQVGGWALAIFLFGFLVPGINNWAHGGGILGGILLGFLLGYNEKRQESLFQKLLACACMAGTIAVLGWAVLSGLLLLLMG